MFGHAATLRVALDEIEMHFIENVRVISDPPEKALRDRNERWLKNMLSPLVVGASRTIEITSPYFVPRKESAKALVGPREERSGRRHLDELACGYRRRRSSQWLFPTSPTADQGRGPAV